MPNQIRDLIEKRNKCVKQARDLVERAQKEGRGLSADEDAQFSLWMDEAEECRRAIDAAERLGAIDAGGGQIDPSGSTPNVDLAAIEARQFGNYVAGRDLLADCEVRDVQVTDDSKGGYWVPAQFSDRIRKKIDAETFVTTLATVTFDVGPEVSLGVPTIDADPDDYDWTPEVVAVTEDTGLRAGRRELKTSLVSKEIKISMAMLANRPDAAEIVMDRLTYKHAVTLEKAALTGSGSGQPLGVFTASAAGIDTSRDVSADNTTTAVTADGLINAKYALRQGYRRNAVWIMHSDTVKQVAKLKDSNGQYIFELGKTRGADDTLLGLPLYSSEFAPNTFTTGQYVGIVGDFSYYEIAMSRLSIQRLDELNARTNQVGFIGRNWGDGMPIFADAFARVTLA